MIVFIFSFFGLFSCLFYLFIFLSASLFLLDIFFICLGVCLSVWCVCVCVCVCIVILAVCFGFGFCLYVSFPFFYLLFKKFFLFVCFHFFFLWPCCITLCSKVRSQTLASEVGLPSTGCKTARGSMFPGNINWSVLFWRYASQRQGPNCVQVSALDISWQTQQIKNMAPCTNRQGA